MAKSYPQVFAFEPETGILVKTYYNPTEPGNFGWMAGDDEGNYGYGRTPLNAIVNLFKVQEGTFR
jgi:hypothetical protein